MPRIDPNITKSDLVRQALSENRFIDALRIAKDFQWLGDHKVTIQRGWAAQTNPRFQEQIGRDPAQLLVEAETALRELYG